METVNLGLAPGFMETVVRQRGPQRTDSNGLPVVQRDWDYPDELEIIGVAVQPLSSRELTDAGWRSVTTGWVLITRPRCDVDVQRDDRIRWGTRTLEVVAEPERWPAVIGGIDHVEAVMQAAPPWPGAGGDTTDGHIAAAKSGAAVGLGWRP